MTTTLTRTADIVNEFALATQNKDIKVLKNLLYQGGEFEIENESDFSVRLIVTKQKFLKWYKTKLENIDITEINYDQCLHCSIGNPVVLFNQGKFPREEKDSSARSKTGLMLNIKDTKITEIRFCFVFLKTENKCGFEVDGEKIRALIAQGLSIDEAIYKVTGLGE